MQAGVLAALLCSLAPWPFPARSAPCNPAPERLAAWRAGTAGRPSCLRLGFCLHSLAVGAGVTLLRQAWDAAPSLLAADFKLAERNVELPAVFMARALCAIGRTPAEYWRQGALEGLALAAGLPVLERRPFWGGAAVLLRFTAGPAGWNGRRMAPSAKATAPGAE